VPLGEPKKMAAALLDIIARPSVREEMARNARRWAEEQFSITVYARKLTQLYRDFLA
jgi:glycosyltransferase involved in cell wall biosynthesis